MSRCLNSFLGRCSLRLALVYSGILFMLLLSVNQLLHFHWTSHPLDNQLASTDDKAVRPHIHWSRGRLDNGRMVRIYEWIWIGEQWDELTKRYDVCLATQSSIDRLFSIAEVSEKWLGPISLAVYIRVPDEWITLNLFVMYMQRCSAAFAQTVSIHVAVPVNYEPSTNDSSRLVDFPLWSTHPCGEPSEFLAIVKEKIVETGEIDSTWLFPQNHMRNIARKTCGTPWVFMTDVDIIPRPNSAHMLQEFYESTASNCPRCAFVIPTFELSMAARYPESKEELIDYAIKGLARPFHLKIYASAQLATDYFTWTHTNLEESPIKVSHNISHKVSFYEPFYIGADVIPAHQERFIGYGFTRSSQVLEALETGWTFKVLTPIFAIHWGLQDPAQNASKPVHKRTRRQAENAKNTFIYWDFVAELKAKKAISLERSKKRQGGSKKI